MIAASEKRGYEAALVDTGAALQVLDTGYRNSSREIWDSPETAAEIFRRIRGHLPSGRPAQSFGYDAAPRQEKCPKQCCARTLSLGETRYSERNCVLLQGAAVRRPERAAAVPQV